MSAINSLVINALKPIAPVAFHEYSGTATTYITFFTYNETAGLIADNDEKTTVYGVQVDIFSQGSLETLVKQVKQALKPLGFARTSEIEMFESTTKTYRKSISFSISLDAQ